LPFFKVEPKEEIYSSYFMLMLSDLPSTLFGQGKIQNTGTHLGHWRLPPLPRAAGTHST